MYGGVGPYEADFRLWNGQDGVVGEAAKRKKWVWQYLSVCKLIGVKMMVLDGSVLLGNSR